MTIPFLAKARTWIKDKWLTEAVRQYYNRVWGMHIGEGCKISLSAKLDKTNPKGVHIGEYTILTFDVVVLTHDYINRRHLDVHIGRYCFVGCRAIILPGVTIGNHCIIGAGTIVREDVPDHSIVAGNPGRIIKSGIETTKWGRKPTNTYYTESQLQPPALSGK
jgi:acetyltransferase-like isoleucine patch superfamily enzyme